MKNNQSKVTKKIEGKDWDGICPNCKGSTFIVEVLYEPNFQIIKRPVGNDGELGWSDGDEFMQESYCKDCGFAINQFLKVELQCVSFEPPKHPQT